MGVLVVSQETDGFLFAGEVCDEHSQTFPDGRALPPWCLSMTKRAREVLKDCESLLAEIKNQDLWGPLFRLRWAGLVALLRAVGDVTDKVDGRASPQARQAVDASWKSRRKANPQATIFWEFIRAERNNILKAYEFGAAVNRTVRPGWGPTTDNAFMRSGPFVNRDPLDLCQEAIDFWHKYLDDIDRDVAMSTSSNP